jgi:hypothetical protein
MHTIVPTPGRSPMPTGTTGKPWAERPSSSTRGSRGSTRARLRRAVGALIATGDLEIETIGTTVALRAVRREGVGS